MKFILASKTCSEYGISLTQTHLDIDEVQSENAEYIACQKAAAAFNQTGRPVIVGDDSWAIPALNGFPGPYMKSMNHWLSAENFLQLTRNLADRRTILTQILVYQDEHTQRVFKRETTGELLREARGGGKEGWGQIVTMPGDGSKTIAEVYLQDGGHHKRQSTQVWHEFAAWYKDYVK